MDKKNKYMFEMCISVSEERFIFSAPTSESKV